jgi:hypothetical protein
MEELQTQRAEGPEDRSGLESMNSLEAQRLRVDSVFNSGGPETG